jgi:transcription antitermination factor NusA-like protein
LKIVSTARVVGRRCLIVVRPATANVLSGRMLSVRRGAQLNALIDELGGEFPAISFWNESTEKFVRQNFASPELQIAMKPPEKRAVVTLNMTLFDRLHRRSPKITRDSLLRLHSEMVELVSEVTGWKISIETVR